MGSGRTGGSIIGDVWRVGHSGVGTGAPVRELGRGVYKHPPHHMLVSFFALEIRTHLFPTPSFRCDYCQLILIVLLKRDPLSSMTAIGKSKD